MCHYTTLVLAQGGKVLGCGTVAMWNQEGRPEFCYCQSNTRESVDSFCSGSSVLSVEARTHITGLQRGEYERIHMRIQDGK